MNLITKKVVKSGNSGHIYLDKKLVGKDVIILPIEYKLLLRQFLSQIEKKLYMKLKDILTIAEIKRVRGCLESEESAVRKAQHKAYIRELFTNIEELHGRELGDILNIIDSSSKKFPKEIYKKILDEYKKSDKE